MNKKVKKLLAAGLSLAMVLTLFGCNTAQETGETAETEDTEKESSVNVDTKSAMSDSEWQMAKDQ